VAEQYFQEIDRWFLENPNEERRFVFNLNHSSVVFDVGAFDGAWARTIYDRYRSKLFCFEPSSPLFTQTCQALNGIGASVFPIALGGVTEEISFYEQGDSTSSHRSQSGASSVTVQKVDICEVLERLSIKEVDFLKINIEGGDTSFLSE